MSKQKTIREHFESFPEPFRTQAIENTTEKVLKKKKQTKKEALYLAFVWTFSRQGHDYWDDFKNTLED